MLSSKEYWFSFSDVVFSIAGLLKRGTGEPNTPIPDALKAELVSCDYTATTNWFDTDVQAIQIINGMPRPVADPRGHGKGLITN